MDEKRGVRTIRRAAALALAAASALHALSWVRPLDARNLFQLEFALHPYEASATLVAPLGEEGIPSLDANAEEGLFYSETFRQLALPNFWSIGVDVKPVAVAGVVVRENFPEAFDAAEIRPGVNAIRIVTDGFPDPGALVLGAGSEINVVDADGRIVGRCHGGFALASGFGHIVSNSIFADLWTEPSFRIKGEIVGEDRELGWTFAFGARFHSDREIRNTMFLNLVRDRVDRWYSGWHPLRNTTLEYRVDFSISRLVRTGEPFGDGAVYNAMLVGKRWSVRKGRNTLGVKIGASYLWKNGYTGRVLEAAHLGWDILLRPSLTF